jgi:hypothetical protein
VSGLDFIVEGFCDAAPLWPVCLVQPDELRRTLCGTGSAHLHHGGGGGAWAKRDILARLRPDHGYTEGDPQLQWLAEWLSGLDMAHRRLFLRFVTGSPEEPLDGLDGLGPITVVRKDPVGGAAASAAATASAHGDSERATPLPARAETPGGDGPTSPTPAAIIAKLKRFGLPSASTCFLYLKLPPYPSREILVHALRTAVVEAGEGFDLT